MLFVPGSVRLQIGSLPLGSLTAFTYYRWRKGVWRAEVGPGVKRLKENERLRKAVSDLTLEKLILRETASGNF